ncbi:GIN domain-containing protein [Bizionia myxarmorum]|uniref:DUF2807 domain-containing protein n=1 Tax=Bizionia myxarmorum TaxID=291186 RepID=A0A5D0QZ46_9FLAO|nr:DUF2807 domain-containing protein [Bizionia myxarmorum]TYB74035.1 DUF2807 domain-containing protein [Bizionia myxarmorum]
MKKAIILITAVFILFSLVSCNESKSDSNTLKTYDISEFTNLNLELIGDVIYEQSDSAYLNVSGSSILIEALKVSDDKGELSIELRNKRKFTGKKKLVIKVGSPHLTKVNFESIGTLHIKNNFIGDEVNITNKGVGEIIIDNFQVEKFNLISKSIGSIKIKGSSNWTSINSVGLGEINASEFKSKRVKVVSEGMENMSVYAEDSIDITMKGLGNINYYGNPTDVKTDISTLGKVNRIK